MEIKNTIRTPHNLEKEKTDMLYSYIGVPHQNKQILGFYTLTGEGVKIAHPYTGLVQGVEKGRPVDQKLIDMPGSYMQLARTLELLSYSDKARVELSFSDFYKLYRGAYTTEKDRKSFSFSREEFTQCVDSLPGTKSKHWAFSSTVERIPHTARMYINMNPTHTDYLSAKKMFMHELERRGLSGKTAINPESLKRYDNALMYIRSKTFDQARTLVKDIRAHYPGVIKGATPLGVVRIGEGVGLAQTSLPGDLLPCSDPNNIGTKTFGEVMASILFEAWYKVISKPVGDRDFSHAVMHAARRHARDPFAVFLPRDDMYDLLIQVWPNFTQEWKEYILREREFFDQFYSWKHE